MKLSFWLLLHLEKSNFYSRSAENSISIDSNSSALLGRLLFCSFPESPSSFLFLHTKGTPPCPPADAQQRTCSKNRTGSGLGSPASLGIARALGTNPPAQTLGFRWRNTEMLSKQRPSAWAFKFESFLKVLSQLIQPTLASLWHRQDRSFWFPVPRIYF